MATDKQGLCEDCNRLFYLSNTEMSDGDGYECPICYQRLKTHDGCSLVICDVSKIAIKSNNINIGLDKRYYS